MKCKGSSWFIERNIDQPFSTMSHDILIEIIKTKVDDQVFVDLLCKYMKVEYGENIKQAIPIKLEVVQGEIMSPIIGNTYASF